MAAAVGEPQSAYALTTYANGVQPLNGLFDGFLTTPAVARRRRWVSRAGARPRGLRNSAPTWSATTPTCRSSSSRPRPT